MTQIPEQEGLIESAKALLQWQAELGVEGIPRPASDAAKSDTTAAQRSPAALLKTLADDAASCTRCDLHKGRTRSVFSRGDANAELVFIGEGPGYHEDQQGAPFVGRAGQLLDRMIKAMGYERDAVYICNVVKCRPPENRTPLPTEAAACARFLVPQVQAVAPRAIVALGRCAAENLGCVPSGGSWRGRWGEWNGIAVMSTYHPAFLLRSPQFKKPVWEDLQQVMKHLGKKI